MFLAKIINSIFLLKNPHETKNFPTLPQPIDCSGSCTPTHGRVLGCELHEMGPLESPTTTRWNFPNRRRDKSSADLSAPANLLSGDVQRERCPRCRPPSRDQEEVRFSGWLTPGDASPALCRAGLGYGAGAGKAPRQVAGGLRNSSPFSVPGEPRLIWEL